MFIYYKAVKIEDTTLDVRKIFKKESISIIEEKINPQLTFAPGGWSVIGNLIQ
jgi:hypothetical protein